MKLFLLFALIAVSHATVAASAVACANPFLGMLASDNVTILESPAVGVFGHCQAEWNHHGSCCEPASLVAMFKKEERQTEVNRVATAKTIDDIDELIGGILTKVNKLSPDSQKRYRKRNKAKELSEVNKNVKVKAKLFSEEKLIKAFKTSSKTCRQQMSAMRGSALCSICSGRSEIFFRGARVLVDQEDCMIAIDTCEDFYLDLAHFFAGLKDTIDALDKSYHFGQESNILKAFGDQITRFMLPDTFIKEFIAYNQASITVRTKLAASICQKILNIRRSTYLDTVANTFIPTFLDLIYASRNTTGALMNEFNRTRGRWSNSGYSYQNQRWSHHSNSGSSNSGLSSNWRDSGSSHHFSWRSESGKWGGRWLATAPPADLQLLAQPSPLLLQGDSIVMVKGDGLFDDVAGKSKLASSNSVVMPMNLTMTFP